MNDGAINRRDLLRLGAALAAVPGLTRAEEPFDSLPPEVLRNGRRNGLVMIQHPTPASLSPHAQIAPGNEPGQPLGVSGQVFAPDGATRPPG